MKEWNQCNRVLSGRDENKVSIDDASVHIFSSTYAYLQFLQVTTFVQIVIIGYRSSMKTLRYIRRVWIFSVFIGFKYLMNVQSIQVPIFVDF